LRQKEIQVRKFTTQLSFVDSPCLYLLWLQKTIARVAEDKTTSLEELNSSRLPPVSGSREKDDILHLHAAAKLNL